MSVDSSLLTRLISRELSHGCTVWLLGDWNGARLLRGGGAAAAWRRWAPSASTDTPDVVLMDVRQVSVKGDVVLTAAAARAADAIDDPAGVVGRAARVIAVVRPSSDVVAGHSPGRGLVDSCDEPVFVARAAMRVLTPWAVLDVTTAGMVIRELAPEVSARQLQQRVAAPLKIASDVAEIGGAVLQDRPTEERP